MRPFLSYSFAVKYVGIYHREYSSYREGCDHKRDKAEKARYYRDDAVNYPNCTCGAVRFVPVFFAVERPREFDADGVALAAFGHIISRYNENKTEKQGAEKLYIHCISYSRGIRKRGKSKAYYGNYPKCNINYFAGVITVFGVCESNGKAYPMNCKHDKRQRKHPEGFAAPLVCLAGYVPMDRHLLGHLIPKDNACDNGQKNYNRRQNKNFQIFLNHFFLLSGS